MYAVRLDLPTAIPALVKAGATVDLRDQDGNTPFHYASMFRQWIVMSALLKLGAHIDALDQNGYTALLSAVDAQDEELVDVLLKMGANPNSCGRVGTPPIVLALSHKTLPCKLGILKRLLESGADVNLPDTASQATALMKACSPARPCVEAVRLLLAHGAHLELTAKNGRTAVHECLRNLSSLPCLKLLLVAGAETNVLDSQGFTPLSMLGHHVNKLDTDLDDKFLSTLSTLLHYGADPNMMGLRASPNFIMASAVGRSCSFEALRLLLAAGVEPVPAHGSARIPRPSPLAFAFDLRKTEVARLLTDGLVYTCRDTVHITKYCIEPPHLQRLQNLVSSAALSLKASEVGQGSGGGGHMSPRRVSSSSSLISSGSIASASAPPGTPRSSSTSFSSSSPCGQSCSPSSKNGPPQRSVSETHSNSMNGAKNGSSVPTSSSSPSLSLSSKQTGISKKKSKTSSSKGFANPSPNMVFPDKKTATHVDTSQKESVHQHGSHTNGSNNTNQSCSVNGSHQNGNNTLCHETSGSPSANGSKVPVHHSLSNGHHKHRSSSSSRSGSQQSLNISRRPSLSDTFSFGSSRNSSPGPSPVSQQEQEAVDLELHELALQVCHTAPSLQQLCRRVVHRAITSRRDRVSCVEKLPIWKKLQRYILYQGPEYQLQNL
ncbi:ankyrin repeat-containing protein [Elysia marginata]|uniref:Ankyrin repeat-containing protein n=1 Tax=Elysia marginata TaxID=1093978 RepID=A0AAV4G5D5_9GAST|nr:ankyrin repeat-containing protein [Elysia marginata]